MIDDCTPALPVAPYLGGKKILARRIIERLRTIPHDGYAEPFVGMGGVFLRRPFRPKMEVMNDLNGEVVNLFRILQRHYPQFIDCLRFQLTSRREFERLAATDPSTLTDLERAARFLYLQRLAFGGKVDGQSFGVSRERPARFDIGRVGPLLEAVHERLSAVTFESLPWQTFVQRYDRPGMLFYLDPPYWGGESDYGRGMFSRNEFAEMAQSLRDLKGRFVLSINDRPEVRTLFAWAELEEATVPYTITAKGNSKRANELIITSPANGSANGFANKPVD